MHVCKRNSTCTQLAVDHGIDETQVFGLLRPDRAAARHQIDGGSSTDQARQAHRAARARDDAELDFRQTETGGGKRHPIGAAERHFETAAKRAAVNARDPGLFRVFDTRHHIRQMRRQRRFAELADIGAGDESAAGAEQHDGLHSRIRVQLRHRFERAPGASACDSALTGGLSTVTTAMASLAGDGNGHGLIFPGKRRGCVRPQSGRRQGRTW
jgi:hypothetical protein